MIGHVAPSRPAWHDRTPTNVSTRYSAATVAPHASTQRYLYTVPTGKKAILQSVIGYIWRNTVGAPVGMVTLEIINTPNAGLPIYLLRPKSIDNTVNFIKQEQRDAQIHMSAGDNIQSNSEDQSTGGTVTYHSAIQVVEYDV